MKFVKDREDVIENAKSSAEILQEMLSLLRGQYWNYWTTHWQVKGPNYYGNHLLFQRLYEALQAEIDTLGEKIVAYFGTDEVENDLIMEKSHEWIKKWAKIGDPVERAIRSEEDMQNIFKAGYKKLDESKDMSLGLDDFLMATANAHETNLYLLGQLRNK
jgi:starvation-inducible DNA-binding protein